MQVNAVEEACDACQNGEHQEPAAVREQLGDQMSDGHSQQDTAGNLDQDRIAAAAVKYHPVEGAPGSGAKLGCRP